MSLQSWVLDPRIEVTELSGGAGFMIYSVELLGKRTVFPNPITVPVDADMRIEQTDRGERFLQQSPDMVICEEVGER